MTEQIEFDFELPTEKKPDLPHFEKPKNDNEKLLNYQWEYKEKLNKKALNAMYNLGYKTALKYIGSEAKKNRHIAELDSSEKEEKAHNAITYIITRYFKISDFAITKSFTAYLYLRVKHELFYTRKIDKIVHFCDDPYNYEIQ